MPLSGPCAESAASTRVRNRVTSDGSAGFPFAGPASDFDFVNGGDCARTFAQADKTTQQKATHLKVRACRLRFNAIQPLLSGMCGEKSIIVHTFAGTSNETKGAYRTGAYASVTNRGWPPFTSRCTKMEKTIMMDGTPARERLISTFRRN
jgi:hypothetical protein